MEVKENMESTKKKFRIALIIIIGLVIGFIVGFLGVRYLMG